LGILLFELLTARHPFQLPRSRAPEAVAALLAERRQGPPRPRLQNPALSSATEAILRKCLEPDPARRYASARELSEDLGRQLQHRPLRHVPEPSVRERFQKWRKRHPRLGIAAVSVLVLLAVVGFFWARHQRLPLLEAHAGLEAFRRDLGAVQVHLLSHHAADRDDYREAAERCLALLARYRIPDQPDWREQPSFRLLAPEERSEVCGELGELLLLLARVAVTENAPAEALHWNELAATCYGDDIPTMLWRQRAELYRRLRRSADADALRDRVRSDTPPNARDLCLAAAELTDQGRFSEALPLLRQAVRRESHDFRIWFDLGLCQEHIGRDSDATASYTTCIALTRDLPQFYYRRGMVYLRTKQYDEAAVDFTEALRQVEAFSAPARADLYLERALAELALRRPDKALDDLNRAEQYPCPTRVFFIRAMARGHLGDAAGARRDREEGLRRTPRDEKSWSARGWARLQGEPPDREGALADFEQALSLNPRSRTALQNKAHLLAEHLERTAEAVTVLDRLLELAPDSVPARASRGVLHARLGDRSAALADARASLERDSRAATQYQVAGIYALTSQQEPRDRHEALALLGKALEQGYGRNLVAGDRDLDPLRTLPEFQRLIAAPR
jgi:tetratricopeptide (TPR) repeat protein